MTDRAREICQELPGAAAALSQQQSGTLPRPDKGGERRVVVSSLAPRGKVKADRDRGILYGETEIDLSCVEQLVDASQTRFIMDALVWCGEKLQGELSMAQIAQRLGEQLNSPGQDCQLDFVSPWGSPNGGYSLPRRQEILAAISRLRTLRVSGRKTVEVKIY